MVQKQREHARPAALVRNPGGHPRVVKGLVNAKAMAKAHPKTFEVPPESRLKKLKPGDFVKVARNNERFWVRLTGWVGKRWHGTVANDLILNDDLKYGESIFFTKKNIYDTLFAAEMKKAKKKAAKKRVSNPGQKVSHDWAEEWLEAFVEAAEKGADCGTAKAIAWAKVSSKRVPNPAAAKARAPKAGKKRTRLGVVPPPRKGKPSTWRVTPTGRYRARLGSLPDKWKREWVRRYKAALKKQETREDLSEAQQKTIAAKQAWDAIKKQGCRLPKSARPADRKSVYVPPNKRARDRDRFQGWICPEWESTEKAREKVIKETIRESERIEKRERARQKKEAVEIKRRKREREKARRLAEQLAKEETKARRKKQTPQEYGEEFRKKHGARGLLPPRKRKKRRST